MRLPEISKIVQVPDGVEINLTGKKICEVKPNTTLKEIIKLIKISLMLEKAEEKQ